jgi:hypothetical protein
VARHSLTHPAKPRAIMIHSLFFLVHACLPSFSLPPSQVVVAMLFHQQQGLSSAKPSHMPRPGEPPRGGTRSRVGLKREGKQDRRSKREKKKKQESIISFRLEHKPRNQRVWHDDEVVYLIAVCLRHETLGRDEEKRERMPAIEPRRKP